MPKYASKINIKNIQSSQLNKIGNKAIHFYYFFQTKNEQKKMQIQNK